MNVQNTMLQGKINCSHRGAAGGATAKGGGTPQVVLVELKSRILGALSKLADRDTHQVGLEDLESIANSLTADGIGIFLTCLYETDVQQKLVLRKECVRLIGTLSTLHGELLSPHLPRIVSNLVRRLKDPDSAVRDACAEAIGMLAANVPYPGGCSSSSDDIASVAASSAAVGVYMKPLLDAMGEQSKGVQVGASLCLSRVFDELEHTPTGIVQRLVPRILKLMTNPVFQAKAALLSVVGSLARAIGAAGSAGAPLLAMIVPLFPDCLENSDWTIRKAAADTLVRMAVVLGLALIPYKATVLPPLEACRFDKVKPVRDSVNDAIAHLKNVPDVDVDQAGSVSRNGGNVKPAGDTATLTSTFTSPAGRSRKPAFGFLDEASTESLTPILTRKRSPLLSDRKPNPEFFRKLEKSSDGVKIEVCAPPPPWGSKQEVEKDAPKASRSGNTGINQSVPRDEPRSDRGPRDEEFPTDATGAQVINRRAAEIKTMTAPDSSIKPDYARGNLAYADASYAYTARCSVDDSDTTTARDTVMWAAIRKQLGEIERQQAYLIDMFQTFVGSSHDGMAKLEATIRGLERAVGHVTQHAAAWGLVASGTETGIETEFRKSKYTTNSHSEPGISGKASYSDSILERNLNRHSYDSENRVNPLEIIGQSTSDSQGDDDSPKYPVNEDIGTMKGESKSVFQFQSMPTRSVWHSADIQTTRATLASIRDSSLQGQPREIETDRNLFASIHR